MKRLMILGILLLSASLSVFAGGQKEKKPVTIEFWTV